MRKLIVKDSVFESVQIVTGESGAEQYAGAELEKYLGKAGISCKGGLAVRIRIDPALQRDGYRICVCEECGISICGGNGRGVIYGVYAFLEKYAGMRFFMPGLEKIGEGDIVVNEGFSFAPVFEMRQSDWRCGNSNVDWCVKNGINQRAIPKEMGGHIKYGGFVHTMESLVGVPQDKQPCLSDPAVLEKAKPWRQ